MRGLVRKASGQRHGAPEFTILLETPVDPFYHWLRAAIVMWHASTTSEERIALLHPVSATQKMSRLALLKKHVQNLGWRIDAHALDFPDGRRYVWTRSETLSLCSTGRLDTCNLLSEDQPSMVAYKTYMSSITRI